MEELPLKTFLHKNKIGDTGMTELSRAIAKGSTASLERLWLNNNRIGDAGITELSRAIASILQPWPNG